MEKYKCIKEIIGSVEVGEVFAKSNKIYKGKDNKKHSKFFVKGGGENDWLLEINLKDKDYFEKLEIIK